MLLIEIENNLCYIKGKIPLHVYHRLEKELSYTWEEFVPTHQRFGRGVMRQCHYSLFDVKNQTFPTGYFHRVHKYFDPDTQYVDKRKYILQPNSDIEGLCKELGLELRDYQLETIRAIHQNSRGVVNIATNGGKTEIMSLIIRSYPECCSVIIAADLTAVNELVERFEKRDIGYKVIDSKHKEVNWDGVNICSLDSLKNIPDYEKLLDSAQILLWDECDDSSTATLGKEIGFRCNAYIRVYFSGTPFTDNEVHNMTLIGIAGEEIVKISNRYLISRGFSATPTVMFFSSLRNRVPQEKIPYVSARKKYINCNEEYCDIICDIAQEKIGEGVVILYENITHGNYISKELQRRKLRFKMVQGSSSLQERNQAKELLEKEVVDIIIASSIWNRGLDFSYPRHWIFAGGMKASNRIKQRYGRALRRKSGENKVYIYEFFISGHRALVEHSKIRYKICLQEGFSTIIMDSNIRSILENEKKKFLEKNKL